MQAQRVTPPAVASGPGDDSELRARYQALVEQIPAVLYVNDVDEDETTLYVSPQSRSILGIEGTSWVDHVHPEDHDRVVARYAAFLRDATEGVDEYRFIRPDGKEIWIHDRIRIIRDRKGEPVLVQGVMFDVTEQKEAQSVIRRHAELLEKVDAVGRRFTDLVLSGAEPKRVLDTLAAIVGNPAVLEDAAHQLIEVSDHSMELDGALLSWAAHSRSGHGTGMDVRGDTDATPGGVGCSWTSIRLRDEEWGRIHLLELEGPVNDIDRLALDRAAAAVGLTFLAERESVRVADSARAGLISDIWRGRWASADEVIARARTLGAELSNTRLAAMVTEVIGKGAEAPGQGVDPVVQRRVHERLQKAIREALDSRRIAGLSAVVGERLLSIVGLPPPADLRATLDEVALEALERVAEGAPGTVVTIGVSGEATPATLHQALTEASEAATHGSRVATSSVHHVEDLGLLRLLTRLTEGPDLPRFVEDELGPVLEHDAANRTPLLPTLRAYLECGGQKARAARHLHLERRSLYYRLERIERLLGRDLDDPTIGLRLQVALQGLDLLRARADRPVGRP